jgi:hypothetical protein
LPNEEFLLPIISETEKKKETSKVLDFLVKQPKVEACLKIITDLIKDDFSFLFKDTEELR